MLYGSKIGFLIDSMIYKPLGKFEPYMFLEKRFQKSGVRNFKMAPMSQRRIKGFWQNLLKTSWFDELQKI